MYKLSIDENILILKNTTETTINIIMYIILFAQKPYRWCDG